MATTVKTEVTDESVTTPLVAPVKKAVTKAAAAKAAAAEAAATKTSAAAEKPAPKKRATKAKVVKKDDEPDVDGGSEADDDESDEDTTKRSASTEPLPSGALVLSLVDDDDEVPVYSSAITGATADPVKDYLKQIGKVALLNAAEEVELAMRIEAGLFAEDKLSEMTDVEKKNALGRAHGFADETQGTLFFDVARIIEKKRPRAFMLENVKNLQSHDKGRTFDVIQRTLRDLGYQIFVKVIDGAHFVPQHRERIIIVGFRDPVIFDWDTLDIPQKGLHKLGEILHKKTGEPELEWDGSNYYDHAKRKVLDKYTLTDNLWAYLQNYKKKHQAAGNGFGFGLVTPDSVTRTLSARYYKDGSEILVSQGSKKNPRRLTPRECARLMGFPDSLRIPVSDTRAYKQFGNSVVVPVIGAVARAMQPMILESIRQEQRPLPRAA